MFARGPIHLGSGDDLNIPERDRSSVGGCSSAVEHGSPKPERKMNLSPRRAKSSCFCQQPLKANQRRFVFHLFILHGNLDPLQVEFVGHIFVGHKKGTHRNRSLRQVLSLQKNRD